MIQTSFKRNPSLNFAMIQKEKCRPTRKVVEHLPAVTESANFSTKPHCYYFVVPFYACQFVSDFQIVLQKLRVLWQQGGSSHCVISKRGLRDFNGRLRTIKA